MPDVRPFTGLLYDTSTAGRLDALTAGPYDNISPADRERLHRANPYNVIRLILGKEEPGTMSRPTNIRGPPSTSIGGAGGACWFPPANRPSFPTSFDSTWAAPGEP